MTHHPNRRAFLGTAAASAIAAPAIATATTPADDTFTFEIQRTEEEWRERLSETEYRILREFGTEGRFTSDLWNEERAGTYACRGCDLPIYDSNWKTVRPIGWVFFHHARDNSVLLGIDEWPAQMTDAEGMAESRFVTEAHCRRCGSHLGHVLIVQGDMLHCINGASLAFTPDEAS